MLLSSSKQWQHQPAEVAAVACSAVLSSGGSNKQWAVLCPTVAAAASSVTTAGRAGAAAASSANRSSWQQAVCAQRWRQSQAVLCAALAAVASFAGRTSSVSSHKLCGGSSKQTCVQQWRQVAACSTMCSSASHQPVSLLPAAPLHDLQQGRRQVLQPASCPVHTCCRNAGTSLCCVGPAA